MSCTSFLVEAAIIKKQICYISIHGKQRVELQTDKSISDVLRIHILDVLELDESANSLE